MRNLCYVLGFIIAVAVAIIPWVVAPVGIVAIVVSLAGVAMLVLLIVGLAKGWPCLFGGQS